MNQVKKLPLPEPDSAFFPFLLAAWGLVASGRRTQRIESGLQLQVPPFRYQSVIQYHALVYDAVSKREKNIHSRKRQRAVSGGTSATHDF